MNLIDQYHTVLKEKGYQIDPAQFAVIDEMQRIYNAIEALDGRKAPKPAEKKGLLARLFSSDQPEDTWIPGLYCWGGVGRGKTFLMDLFYAHLPTNRKLRRHFHRFMLELHDQLSNVGHIENPIERIVGMMGEDIDIICLDEFFVSDITDAMLLSKVFSAMRQNGITLVTTSNIPPDELYKNGLQREQFLPAIAWIHDHLHIHHIDDGEDHRDHFIKKAHIFRTPDTPEQREALEDNLRQISGAISEEKMDKSVRHYFRAGSREIPIHYRDEHAIIFEFSVLCEGNYSQKDYIEIARRFPYVGLIGVPVMDELAENAARRFLLLIDEFYDRRVKLTLTAEAPMEAIYQGKRLSFEYQRVQSRLAEMRSQEYWREGHLP
ncbi:AFG1 family ATPase [Suttonella sp. R2A3]|uniref:cell division protein ZapE n=1 Tax=Suttonella sp. R2A3 TaxID=2908648 RepID=UPI001EEDB0F8|nr:cell division protein ZapE [Suttonella sp. R2A3]UJF23733.1 AFG1 family ATPase [Suttonella sp. R2A3]